jgi:hypothetical protein
MVAFDPSADLIGEPGYRYMHNSFVTLFCRRPLLDNAIAQLEAARYHMVLLEAKDWETPKQMHRDLAQALDFPAYYGQNLDALDECLRDVVAHRYGWPGKATGLVLILVGFDSFAKRWSWEAQELLDTIARQARSAVLFGERMFCLVQSDDPLIGFDPVGATPVIWNDAEWLAANRRMDRGDAIRQFAD